MTHPGGRHWHGHHHVWAHGHHHVRAHLPLHHGAYFREATVTVDHGGPDWAVAVTVTGSSSFWAGTLA